MTLTVKPYSIKIRCRFSHFNVPGSLLQALLLLVVTGLNYLFSGSSTDVQCNLHVQYLFMMSLTVQSAEIVCFSRLTVVSSTCWLIIHPLVGCN